MARPAGAFPVLLRHGPSSLRGSGERHHTPSHTHSGAALAEWPPHGPHPRQHLRLSFLPTTPVTGAPAGGSVPEPLPARTCLVHLPQMPHARAHTHTLCLQPSTASWAPSAPPGPKRRANVHHHHPWPSAPWGSSARVSVPRRRKPRLRERRHFPEAPAQPLGGAASPTRDARRGQLFALCLPQAHGLEPKPPHLASELLPPRGHPLTYVGLLPAPSQHTPLANAGPTGAPLLPCSPFPRKPPASSPPGTQPCAAPPLHRPTRVPAGCSRTAGV